MSLRRMMHSARSPDGAKVPRRRETSVSVRTRVLAFVLRPVLARVLQRYLRRQPRPAYTDRALVIGPHPVRVLILGAGLAVGYGSADEVLALPHQLGQALEQKLRRGIVVECRAEASVRLDRTLELMGMTGAATFDVVVWLPTLEETFHGRSGRWARNLTRTIERIQTTGRHDVRIVLMGVPRSEGTHLLQRIGSAFADEVNARIAGVADRTDRVEFLPVPPRTISSWDTPLFDAAYQGRVVEDVAALLGALQTRAALDSYARPVEVTDHGAWSSKG